MSNAPCWGWEAYPGFAPEGPFTAVAAAWEFYGEFPTQLCAVRLAGDVRCWNGPVMDTLLPPVGAFDTMDASTHLACGLRLGGEATCWGFLDWQPGRLEPRWEPAAGAFVSLSVGTSHACGLRAGGEVSCWGADMYGETSAPSGEFAGVSAGEHLSCGLRLDGTVECWGANQWWQASPLPGTFDAVDAGAGYACGIRPGGRVECWGNDPGGALDPPGVFAAVDLASSCGLRPDGALACWGTSAPAPEALPDGPFESISGYTGANSGRSGGCGLRPNGDVACWGDLADWEPEGSFRAVIVGPQTCGVRIDNAVVCRPRPWPDASQPERSQSSGDAIAVFRWPSDSITPLAAWARDLRAEGIPNRLLWVQEPPPAGPFAALAGGALCGIRPGGRLGCWGDAEPRLDRAESYDYVTRRFDYWCGIDTSRRLDCAGATDSHQQGASEGVWSDDYPSPPGTFVDVAVGLDRACAIRGDTGEIECWGPAALADEHRPPSGTFTAISIGMSQEQVGDYYPRYFEHTCAIAADTGEIICWGDNRNGQTRVPPARLAAGPYRDIAAGGEHTCALRHTGEIICWGDNRHGQTEAPAGVHTALTAGRWHTCALTVDSDAVCWGDGIADGYIDPPDGILNIAAPTGSFTAISAGDHHTCALRADGELACWLSY